MPYISQIANDLLVTPFDKKAYVESEVSKKLTEKEFCEYCHSRISDIPRYFSADTFCLIRDGTSLRIIILHSGK